ncbi:MAG: DinB family protein [Pyrinomonadaceae bacterium]|nr:DinB family protein [Pyrinomonadaceae bacterium]
MENSAERVVADLQNVADQIQKAFGEFSAAQINWKPAAESWSVGQCLEHLIKSNELFYGEFDKIAEGTRRQSFLENWSPLSGFFAGLLIRSLKNDGKKYKAPTQAIVPPSEIDPNIVEIYAAHNAERIQKIRKSASADWTKIVVTSPFLKIMTYRFDDAMTVMIEHDRRHFRQAKRVVESSGFPV